LRLKDAMDILAELRQGNGLNREARSLYTVVLQARSSDSDMTYTSVGLNSYSSSCLTSKSEVF